MEWSVVKKSNLISKLFKIFNFKLLVQSFNGHFPFASKDTELQF